jgi:hypothetical protein
LSRLALDCDPPTYASHVAWITNVSIMPGFLVEGGLTNFLPGLASNWDPHNLCLQHNWDYPAGSCEPVHPANMTFVFLSIQASQIGDSYICKRCYLHQESYGTW